MLKKWIISRVILSTSKLIWALGLFRRELWHGLWWTLESWCVKLFSLVVWFYCLVMRIPGATCTYKSQCVNRFINHNWLECKDVRDALGRELMGNTGNQILTQLLCTKARRSSLNFCNWLSEAVSRGSSMWNRDSRQDTLLRVSERI